MRQIPQAGVDLEVGTYDYDLVTGHITWSESLFRIYGFPPFSVQPSFELITSLVVEEDRSQGDARLQEALATGHAQYTYRITTGHGVRTLSSWMHIVRDRDGQPFRMVGVVVDNTGRKELEAQLQHAQRLEAVGRLAGGIAHDFNNLLTVIGGQAERLAPRLAGDPVSAAQLEIIQHAATRAAALTGQLLAFSRRQVLQPKLTSLNDVVSDCERMLGRVIGADVHVVTDLASDLGSTMADPGQMEQVVMNLAINARDAMPRGGTLTLRTRNAGEPGEISAAGITGGPYVTLAVEDTGHGMDEETLAHVFEPFFTTKERGRGTGLGLPTVYGIVTQSGGDIRIQTAVGRGTTVTVYLPRIEVAKIRESIAATFIPEPAPTGRETVLLVEDDPLVRDLARDFIADAGYVVLEAETAAVAVVVFGSHHVDAMVSDVGLPDISGTELVAALRGRAPGLAVVLMSGYTGEEPVVASEFDALTTFVQKPFTKAGLLRALREVLDHRRAQAT